MTGPEQRDVTIGTIQRELTAFSRRARTRAAGLHPELTLVDYSMLDYLQERGGARAVDLAAHFLLDKSTVSRQVAGLRERGLLEPGAELRPSAAGRALLRTAHRRQRELLAARFTGWTDADLAAFAGFLRRYNDAEADA